MLYLNIPFAALLELFSFNLLVTALNSAAIRAGRVNHLPEQIVSPCGKDQVASAQIARLLE